MLNGDIRYSSHDLHITVTHTFPCFLLFFNIHLNYLCLVSIYVVYFVLYFRKLCYGLLMGALLARK